MSEKPEELENLVKKLNSVFGSEKWRITIYGDLSGHLDVEVNGELEYFCSFEHINEVIKWEVDKQP